MILLDPDGRTGSPAISPSGCGDRRAGIGGEGVLRAVRTAAMTEAAGTAVAGRGSATGVLVDGARGGSPEWFMDYRNADGSVAEMCGNGIRVFARYLAEHGLAGGKEFTVATRSGPRQVRLEAPGSAAGNGGTGGFGRLLLPLESPWR